MILEQWKQYKEDKFTILFTDESQFKDAIQILGGKLFATHSRKGVDVSWELSIDDSKANDAIEFCRKLKKMASDSPQD